jgi:hypothetical protein
VRSESGPERVKGIGRERLEEVRSPARQLLSSVASRGSRHVWVPQSVARAAIEAVILSLIALLLLDFVIETCSNTIDNALHPETRRIW